MLGNRDELLCRLDLDASIVEANDTFCAFFGRAQSELIDLPFAELFAQHDRAPIGAHLSELRAGRYPKPREMFLSAASGTRHLIQWIDYPLFGMNGEVLGLQSVGRDITDQRGEEWRELCQIRERLELGLRGTNDGLWDWNIATGEVYYSPRFLEILSVDKSSFLPEIESVFARLHPEDMARTQHEVDYHLVERKPYMETSHAYFPSLGVAAHGSLRRE
ncbi:MAG: PAS domain-containing protein, partial [Planctomycetota bacterium]